MKTMFRSIAVMVMILTLLVPSLAMAHTPAVKGSSEDLRAGLGQLLGEHALLAIIAMQKGIDGAPDFEQAAGALLKNSDDLTAAVSSVYGAEGGAAFKEIWNSHIGYFVAYVQATAKNDQAGKTKALADLEEYRMEQAEFFATANPKFFKKDAIAAELKEHIDHLLQAFDAYVAKDYAKAYATARVAYAHMYMTADALAGGIAGQFPDKFPAIKDQPASDLRSALGRLLGEHATLAVLAMQKGIDGKPDFEAAAGALLANSDDLTAAVASVYGKAGGDAFKEIWNSHIGYFVAYVQATAKNDQAGRTAAVADLEEYRMEQAAFFATANPEFFKKDAIAAGLKEHIDHLLQAFDAYVAKDYAKVYSSERVAYAHMFMTADALAGGIVGQFPDKFHAAATPAPGHEGHGGMMNNVAKIWLKIGSKSAMVDDKTVAMDVAPHVMNGTTFVSLKTMTEALGAGMNWDQKTKTVWVNVEGTIVTFWIGSKEVAVGDQRMMLPVAPHIMEGRTQVPLRYIAEMLGWELAWNQGDGSITLTKAMAQVTAQ